MLFILLIETTLKAFVALQALRINAARIPKNTGTLESLSKQPQQ